jgi:hypothetical protein
MEQVRYKYESARVAWDAVRFNSLREFAPKEIDDLRASIAEKLTGLCPEARADFCSLANKVIADSYLKGKIKLPDLEEFVKREVRAREPSMIWNLLGKRVRDYFFKKYADKKNRQLGFARMLFNSSVDDYAQLVVPMKTGQQF